MEQLSLFPVPSPCVGVCEVNQKGYCKGCLRNRKERLYWFQFTNLQKHHIVRLCAKRRRAVAQLAIKQQEEKATLPEQMDFDF